MNINLIKTTKQYISKNNSHRLDIRDITVNSSLIDQYTDICQQHGINRKWILMINPEEQSLEEFRKINNIDTSKILKVNTKQSGINLQNLASALCTGNCSAIILCNPCLKREELKQLNKYVRNGKTACIVLKNKQWLH